MAVHVIDNRVKCTTTTTGTGSVAISTAVAGYKTFGSAMASGDTCDYCIVLGSEWEVGVGTYYSTTNELVRTSVLSSSNSDAVVSFSAGTKEAYITMISERTRMTEDVPTSPTSGTCWWTSKVGGRYVPRWTGPSGLDTAVQPSMWGNSITLWLPGSGTTVAIAFGVTWTTSTTQAHPTIANTNFMTQLKRATFTTTTTAANTAGVRSAAPICWRGNAANLGGFFFAARFGITTYVADMRVFIGLAEKTTAAPASDPITMSNAVGICKMTTSALWQIMAHGSIDTSYTLISTNAVTRAADNSGIYDFFMFTKPNDTQITFSLQDVGTGVWAVTNQSISTTLPLNTLMLTAHCGSQCVTTTTANAIFLTKMYIESDS